jgi:hypothetical protein
MAGFVGEEVAKARAGVLLPLPDLADGVAGRIYFVFESAASVIETRVLLRRGLEKEHASVADGSARPEFAQARSLPGDRLAIRRRDQSLAFAISGAIRPDRRCIGAYAGGGNAQHGAAVFKRYFCRWWVNRQDPSHDSLAFRFADLFSKHEWNLFFRRAFDVPVPGGGILQPGGARYCCYYGLVGCE